MATEGNLGDIKFEIDSIKLHNSSVNFQDENAGILLSLHDVNIETGKLTDSTPGDVTASFRLESVKPHIDTKVKLNSHFLFELKTNHYELANFEGEMEGEAAGINNLALNFQGTLNNYPAEDRLTIDKFIVTAKGKIENRKIEAKLDIPKLQLIKNKFTGNTLAFNTSLLQEEENFTATFELPAFEANDTKLQAENLTANFDLFRAGRTLQGKFNSPISLDFSSMQMQLPAIVSSFSGTHPLFTSKLIASATGDMLANFSEQTIKLNFKSKIDDSNFTGSMGLQDYAHPAFTLDIGVNKLDLDRYLAIDWAKRLQDDALPFDFSALKDLNLRGKLRSNELKFAKLKFSNLVAEIKADQSTLIIEPVSARLYGGAVTGSMSISANEIPKITFKQKLSGVQINTLLADIIPGEAKLVGKGNLTLDLNATGANMAALRKSLSGNVSLALGRGSLAGLNLTEALVAGKSQLGIPDSVRTETAKFTESTAYAEFKSTFEINEGNARNSDFLMKSPLFVSKGEGDIALETGQLNYHLNTAVASNLKRSSNGELAELRGINIPMRLTGHYATPAITIDFGAASGGNLAKLLKPSAPKTSTPPPVTARSVKK